ncbi:hypothetical protein [Lentzea xinjiangensis]|nr:hypothetical protein [Lentzea xinjiangensis]
MNASTGPVLTAVQRRRPARRDPVVPDDPTARTRAAAHRGRTTSKKVVS